MKTTDRPLILISNDDGLDYGGIQTLIAIARRLGDVVVVAPRQHQSGMASAITVSRPLRAMLHSDEPGYRVWQVDGTPTDCIKLAFSHLLGGHTPDLVLSGINHGYNAGISTIYSGTMGVVFEASAHLVPAIAFSHENYHPEADFTPCEATIEQVISAVLRDGLPTGVCLNVNFPNSASYPGMKITTTAMGHWESEYEHRVDPHGQDYYWLTGHYECDDPDDDSTDMYWLGKGWITVTPCHLDQTDFAAMPVVGSMLNVAATKG